MRVTGAAELKRWQEDFHAMAEPPAASELRRHAVRHGRLLRLLLWGELVLALAMVAGPLWWLAVAPTPRRWAWAATLWGFLAIALVFAAINRRGAWRPLDRSLAAQLELTELRCRRQRRTLLFAPLLFLGECVAVLVEVAHFAPGSLATAGALLAVAALVTALWWAFLYTRTRQWLAQVAAIRRELAPHADEVHRSS